MKLQNAVWGGLDLGQVSGLTLVCFLTLGWRGFREEVSNGESAGLAPRGVYLRAENNVDCPFGC